MASAVEEREPGIIVYECPRDKTSWETPGAMYDDSFDPACDGDGDRCPTCGEECDQVMDWMPDTPRGYELWRTAPERLGGALEGSEQ